MPEVRPYQILTNKFGRYPAPYHLQQRSVIKALREGKIYEENTIDFIARMSVGKDVVHAGAFIGDFFPALSQARRIFAFEPVREHFEYAKNTIEINNLTNIELMNTAVGISAGSAKMRVKDRQGEELGGGSRIERTESRTETENHFEEINIVRIDDVVPDSAHIAVIHLDVEGHEFEAILGATNTIQRSYPVIILERALARTEMQETLNLCGYHKVSRIDRNFVYSHERPTLWFKTLEVGREIGREARRTLSMRGS